MTSETVLLYGNIILLLLLLRLSMRFLIIFSPCCIVDTVYYSVRKQPAILFITYSAVFTASVRSICHSRPAAAACKHPFEAASNRFVPSATRPHAKKRFVCRCPRTRVCSVHAAASHFLWSEKYVPSSSSYEYTYIYIYGRLKVTWYTAEGMFSVVCVEGGNHFYFVRRRCIS